MFPFKSFPRSVAHLFTPSAAPTLPHPMIRLALSSYTGHHHTLLNIAEGAPSRLNLSVLGN